MLIKTSIGLPSEDKMPAKVYGKIRSPKNFSSKTFFELISPEAVVIFLALVYRLQLNELYQEKKL